MDRAAALVAVTVVVATIGPALPVGAQSDSVSIDVAVDDRPVSDGDRIVSQNDPNFDLNVTADRRIEAVIVRLDDAREEVFRPNATSMTEQFRVEVLERANEFRIVVRTVNGTTHDLGFTYLKDTRPPSIRYFGSFAEENTNVTNASGNISTLFPGAEGNISARLADTDRSQVIVTGEAIDATGLSSLTIDVRYTFLYAGRIQSDRTQYRLDQDDFTDRDGDGYSEFSQEIYLPPAFTTIRIEKRDQLGNADDDYFVFRLTDTLRPSFDVRPIGLDDSTVGNCTNMTVTNPKIRIKGRVSDNYQLLEVGSVHTIERFGGNNTSDDGEASDSSGDNRTTTNVTVDRPVFLHRSGGRRPSPEHRNVDIDYTYRLYQGNNSINITAADISGNRANYSCDVRYQPPNPVPEIFLTPASVRPGPNGTYVIGASVSDGNVTTVLVEARDPDSGAVVNQFVAYDGSPTTEAIQIDATLTSQLDRTEFVVRALIPASARQNRSDNPRAVEQSVVVERQTATPTEEPTPTDTPTATDTPDESTPTDTPADDETPTATDTPEESTSTPVDDETPTATDSPGTAPPDGGDPPDSATNPVLTRFVPGFGVGALLSMLLIAGVVLFRRRR